MRRILLPITILLLAGACTSTQPIETPTSSPLVESSEDEVMEAGEIIFDGEECTYTGLPELPLGVYSFVVKDLSDMDIDFALERYLNGKTWQDYLVYIGEGDEYVPEPEWVHVPTTRGSWKPGPDGGKVHTYVLITEGNYGLVSWTFLPFHIWPCGPLQVIEISPE